MNIIETHIEEMLISAEEAPDEDILSGYSILGILDNDRELLLADIIANTHPAMDAEAHDDLNSPTLEESDRSTPGRSSPNAANHRNSGDGSPATGWVHWSRGGDRRSQFPSHLIPCRSI